MTEKTISEAKIAAAKRNLILAAAANARKIKDMPVWVCEQCGIQKPGTVHQRRQKYCCKICMAKAYSARFSGTSNPNYSNAGARICEECGKNFNNYNQNRRFCSLSCRDKKADQLRTNAKKDANHYSAIKTLTNGGASVVDISRAMFGVPDLLVWHKEKWNLIEVKNPATYYGRKGLNKMQKEWVSSWNGGPVYVIWTDDDCSAFLSGTLKSVN